MGYIYRITNLINKKSYIGESKRLDVKDRWNEHIKSCKTGSGATALISGINEYGLENFKFEIIIICFDEDRFHYEVEYINKFNTLSPNGYNIMNGKSGSFHNINISEKMKASVKWQTALKEKRVGNSVNKHTQKTKSLISLSVKRYFQDNPNNRINIEKHRAVMTQKCGKRIHQYNLDGILINSYDSIRLAARETNVSRTTIQANLYGKISSGKGYKWVYA